MKENTVFNVSETNGDGNFTHRSPKVHLKSEQSELIAAKIEKV